MIDSTDIFRNRGSKRRNRDRMAAYNSSKSSQSSASLRSESDCASEYSSGCSAVSERCRHRSHTQGTEDGGQTETERLRYKVRSLRAELHQTMDSLEQAQHETARQKQLTELKVSLVVAGLSDRYAGYENGRVIYSWERKQREQRENAERLEIERLRLEAMRQAAQQRSEARLRAMGLDAWIQAPYNPSARRRLI